MFGWSLNTSLGSADQKVVALVTLALITILNIYGVKLVAIVNTGVVFEILGMVVFAVILAVAHNNQGIGAITNSGGASITPAFFLVGMFMSLYVIYGFDTASTLAEETRNPRAEAPKAVLASVIGAFVIGAIFLWGVLIAVPSMGDAVANFSGPQASSRAVFSSAMSSQPNARRLGGDLRVLHVDPDVDDPAGVRDGARRSAAVLEDDGEGQPAAAHADRRVHRSSGLSAVPFIQFAGASTIAVAATAMIYFSYFLGNIAVMRARTKGWPKTKAPFSLGTWGKVVNVVAILWGAAMLVNF